MPAHVQSLVRLPTKMGGRTTKLAWTPPRPAKPEAFNPLTVTTVETADQFHALSRPWRDLWRRSVDRSPFNSWEFVATWWQHFVVGRNGGATGDIQVLVVRDNRGQIVGIAPKFVEHNMGQPELGTTLQPFGRSNSFETMTDEPMMVIHRAHERQAQAAIATFLRDSALGSHWDVAVIRSMISVCPPANQPSVLRWRGPAFEVDRHSTGTIAAPLGTSWDRYRAGLSKSMRDNIAYYPRRLEREVGAFSVQIARRPTSVARATEHLIRLHRLRSLDREGIPHRDHIPGQEQAAFIEDALARLAAIGRVAVATLTVGGEVIGAHAFLQTPRTVCAYYSGFDPQWRRFSPLTIITAEFLRQAIDLGARQLCFAPGQAPWKSRWGGKPSGHVNETSVYAVRPGALFRGVFRRLRWRAAAGQLLQRG
jgi:CelD/BcsL family acetyltransferase involved in cellulose biosynthesis